MLSLYIYIYIYIYICMYVCVFLTLHLDTLCNKNQLDVLFILSLFAHSTSTCFSYICTPSQSTSTCFSYICTPSSGGILYIYDSWYVSCFAVDCCLGWDGTRPAVDRPNKLRINSASGWFFLNTDSHNIYFDQPCSTIVYCFLRTIIVSAAAAAAAVMVVVVVGV